MSRVLPSCIFAPILQESAAVPPVSVGIIACNTHGNTFSCKFSCILAISRLSAGLAGGGCRLPDVLGVEPEHSPPLPVAVCPPFGPEHWPPGDSSPLPSPLPFSSGQCLPLVVSVPPWCSPALGFLLGSLVLVSALLGMVVYGGIFFFIQPRPELTRAREGLPLLFPISLPSVGLLTAFFSGGRCRALLRRPESVAGRFCPFSIFPGAKSKIYTGIKLAPLGRFWFRPGGAGLGFCGCLLMAGGWVRR